MRIVGYVIVRDLDMKLFSGYKHPGTREAGYPVWTPELEGRPTEGGKAAIYCEAKGAMSVAEAIGLRDHIPCTVRPLHLDVNQTAEEDAWLNEVADFLQQHEDIKDGENGQPQPNTAMSLLTEMKRLGLYRDTD